MGQRSRRSRPILPVASWKDKCPLHVDSGGPVVVFLCRRERHHGLYGFVTGKQSGAAVRARKRRCAGSKTFSTEPFYQRFRLV